LSKARTAHLRQPSPPVGSLTELTLNAYLFWLNRGVDEEIRRLNEIVPHLDGQGGEAIVSG
jgi:hypothetical protein